MEFEALKTCPSSHPHCQVRTAKKLQVLLLNTNVTSTYVMLIYYNTIFLNIRVIRMFEEDLNIRLWTACRTCTVLSYQLLLLQLKKETVNSNLQWTAGCTNCTGQTPCKASTQPPCHLECCNVTSTSCLWLNGTLNVPSFATRGPHLHTELIASLLCLFAISFLLWGTEEGLAQPLCGSLGHLSFE